MSRKRFTAEQIRVIAGSECEAIPGHVMILFCFLKSRKSKFDCL